MSSRLIMSVRLFEIDYSPILKQEISLDSVPLGTESCCH